MRLLLIKNDNCGLHSGWQIYPYLTKARGSASFTYYVVTMEEGKGGAGGAEAKAIVVASRHRM